MFRASGRLKDLRRNCAGNSTGLSTCRPNGLLPRRFVPSGLCSRSDRIGAFASERPCSGRACSGEPCSIRFDLRQGSVRRIPHPAVFLCRTPCRLCRRNALRARLYNVPRISCSPSASCPNACTPGFTLCRAAHRARFACRNRFWQGTDRSPDDFTRWTNGPAFCAQRALFAI